MGLVGSCVAVVAGKFDTDKVTVAGGSESVELDESVVVAVDAAVADRESGEDDKVEVGFDKWCIKWMAALCQQLEDLGHRGRQALVSWIWISF